MEVKRTDRPVNINSGEECGKSEASTGKKPIVSKGIAESESKFETVKSNFLFQDSIYSNVRSANASPKACS
jgi:hypothetical protein